MENPALRQIQGGSMSTSTSLMRYEQARVALRDCVRIDEAAEIRDKAEALKAYARQRDDSEMGVWVSEIHLRACVRIGEISRELEKSAFVPRQGASLPSGGKTKAEALAEAGISTSAANRYEEIAGGKEARGIAAANAAAEAHFAKARQDNKPATLSSLRGAIHQALVETLGEPPPRRKRAKKHVMSHYEAAFIDFAGALRQIVERGDDAPSLAPYAQPRLIDYHLAQCQSAVGIIAAFEAALQQEARRHAA
jgi:hypothetical protein